MRLLVEVEPADGGPSSSLSGAYANIKLKGKPALFSLPVQPHYTFAQVWTMIEERYKRNYLSPSQTA